MADECPHLFEVATGRAHPIRGRQVFSVGSNGLAEADTSELPDDRLRFEIGSEQDRWFIRPIDAANRLSVNQVLVEERAPLAHRAIVQVGRHVWVFVQREDPAVSTSFEAGQWLVAQAIGGAEQDEPLARTMPLTATLEMDRDRLRKALVPLELPGSIELPQQPMLIGRDPDRAAICLPDIRVSRIHARIARKGRIATITDLKSANGTFVNGHRIDGPEDLSEGDRVQIGSYRLVFTGTALYPLTHDKNVQLAAENLTCRVPDRARRGHWKVILDDVSLVIRPREFLCILGPSGSGKSTLLSALSGRRRADEGCVLLNGEDLYTQFDALKQNLAVVPQNDVLHDVLPLNKALRYTAKMRLPADMSRRDIDACVDHMLQSVHLHPQRSMQIRRLSGGQAKRASWVNEAICNPSLIFLDEVTSGLDEQTDCEMMQLFRRMADDGKTIVCVTHSVTYVEQYCDLIAVLAPGGVCAYLGPPSGALSYFGIQRLGDLYQRLSLDAPHQWKRRFRESTWHRDYVARRLPEVIARMPETTYVPPKGRVRDLFTAVRQLGLLTHRYLAIKLADKRSLAAMLGQSLFIAFLLVWLFGNISALNVQDEANQLADLFAPGLAWSDLFPEDQERFLQEAELAKRADYSSRLLFLLCISCIWFGCNGAAKEIVKERVIYNKERDVGLNVASYYGSKLVLLGVLAVLQTSLLYGCVRYFTRLGGDATDQWLLLCLASLVGVGMGLAISAIANTEDLAMTIVPISLIPQIIMAGLIAPLLHYTRGFSQVFISAYWAYQGLLATMEAELQDQLRDAGNLDLGREWNLAVIGDVLVAHLELLAVVAILALYVRDRGRSS